MNQVIDPVTGMAVPADPAQQMIQQPINVGMPGSTVVPAGVGHNMQQPVQAGGRMLAPIRQNGNPLQDPTPNYPKGKNIGQVKTNNGKKGLDALAASAGGNKEKKATAASAAGYAMGKAFQK